MSVYASLKDAVRRIMKSDGFHMKIDELLQHEGSGNTVDLCAEFLRTAHSKSLEVTRLKKEPQLLHAFGTLLECLPDSVLRKYEISNESSNLVKAEKLVHLIDKHGGEIVEVLPVLGPNV